MGRPLQPYAREVVLKARDLGILPVQLASRLRAAGYTVADQSVRNWWSGERRIPAHFVPEIDAILGLGLKDVEAVMKRWPRNRWPRARAAASTPAATALPPLEPVHTAIRDIASGRAALSDQIRRLEQQSLDVLGMLDGRHFFVSSTTAIRNYLWYPEDELGLPGGPPDLLPGRVRSIRAGGLFLMLVPTRRYFVDRVQPHLGTDAPLRTYQDVEHGIATFRRRAVAALGGGPAAERAFAEGQQILPVSNFPFTAAGWTVNLLGERQSGAQLDRHVFIHGPYASGLSLQLWPEQNHYFPGWLWGWMQGVVRREAERRGSRGDVASRFYRRLWDRMRTRG